MTKWKEDYWHGGQQTMFPCKKCKTMYSEESGAYKGFTCEDCLNKKEDKKQKCSLCGKGASGKYQVEGSTVCAKCYNANIERCPNCGSKKASRGSIYGWQCEKCGTEYGSEIW